ncbi:MAG: substrate-binding domain-containing protein [Lachnospiraceae bacterium]|jgi:ribose transport system substrate-binding protein|nr:substrate-binding domain-containing protein [Lachnospiraceae bacterium]
MKRKLVLGLTLAVLAAGLAGCGNSAPKEAGTESAAKSEELYSMVVFTKGAEYFNWCYAGAKDAAASIGSHITVELQGPAEWDASLEARAVEQVTAKNPEGILVASADETTLNAAIGKALDAGIPVIGFDSDASDSGRLAYVGTDNYDFGATAAKSMAEMLGGEGEVAICMVPGAIAQEERAEGFKSWLAENAPDIKVVSELNDEGDVAKSETVCTALLQSNPNIKGIFSTHGYGAPGAAAAARTLNMLENVVIIGSDYSSAVIELLQSGDVEGTVVDDPYLIGYEAFMLAYAAAHPTEVPSANPPFGHVPPIIYGGSQLLTGEMLKDEAVLAKYQNPPAVN